MRKNMGPPNSPRRGGSSGRCSRKSKKKKSGGICCKLSLNSLSSIWYCALTVTLQLYIVASGIKRFGQYISLPWPMHDQPYWELNAYVGFLGASVVIMPFFIATAVLKIGNYPNDGQNVCVQDSPSRKEDYAVYQNIRSKKKDGHWARALWKHAGPTAAFLHVASAFCLLLPKIFIQPQLIRHGFLKRSETWSSELDFLLTRKDRLVMLPFLSTVNITELEAHEEARAAVASLQVPVEETSLTISAEFVNFAISLLAYALRYASVLWNSSKSLSFLFSVQLFINGLQQLLAFVGFGILYKVHICGPAAVLVRFSPLTLNVSTTVLLFFFYNVAVSITSCTLYAYALQKHREWTDRQLRRHHIIWAKERWRLWGYTPHVSAFVVLVVMATAATPIAYDLTLVYCGSLDGFVLASLTSMITHMFLWILLWLFLTVKQRWVFESRSRDADPKTKSKPYRDTRALPCNGHVPGVDSDLAQIRGSRGEAPLLVIDEGCTYQIRDRSCRKLILNLAHQSMASQANSSSTDEEEIYWLKPNPSSPKSREECGNVSEERPWTRNLKKSPQGSKPHKVTFEEALLNSSGKRKSPKHQTPTKIKKSHVNIEDFVETGSEDGDYATLTKMPEAECLESSQAYRSLCPLGENGACRMEGCDRLNSPMRRSNLPYFDPGSESARSTDSGTDPYSSGATTVPRTVDSFSVGSNSPEKGGPASDSSSGFHSGCGSNPGTSSMKRRTVETMDSVDNWRIPSNSKKPSDSHETASLTNDSMSSTIRIWRNTNSPEKVKFSTFSDSPACIVAERNE